MDDKEISQAIVRERSGLRRLGLIMAGIGLGSALAYLFTKALSGRKESSLRQTSFDNVVDDRGTGQEKAAQILRRLRDRAFEASDEKLAIALGRPMEEIVAWNAGQEVIDDDVVMKARGIAMHRGVHVD